MAAEVLSGLYVFRQTLKHRLFVTVPIAFVAVKRSADGRSDEGRRQDQLYRREDKGKAYGFSRINQ